MPVLPDTMSRRDQSRAFSLVELVLVVIILGVIGAIAIPRISRAGQDAASRSFAKSIRTFADAALAYEGMTGGWPGEADAGVAPSELKGMIDTTAWERETPLGGDWDSMTNSSGVGYGIAAVYGGAIASETMAQLVEVDQIIDDGNSATGAFRLASGTTYVLILERSASARVVSSDDLDTLQDNGAEILGELTKRD
ncbi:MAG: prepilin-type N-terminal cleavage/methylation domain-containing protein [Planctomycetota bacterium]